MSNNKPRRERDDERIPQSGGYYRGRGSGRIGGRGRGRGRDRPPRKRGGGASPRPPGKMINASRVMQRPPRQPQEAHGRQESRNQQRQPQIISRQKGVSRELPSTSVRVKPKLPKSPMKPDNNPMKLIFEKGMDEKKNMIGNTLRAVDVDRNLADFFLDDHVDYLVVGVLGKCGVGKSTILNGLIEKDVFKTGNMCGVKNETRGIDFYVTDDRFIFLDCEPVFSSSKLERVVSRDDRKKSKLSDDKQRIEQSSMKLGFFMFSVCHIILVVQDHPNDRSMLSFVRNLMDYQKYYPNVFSTTKGVGSPLMLDHVKTMMKYQKSRTRGKLPYFAIPKSSTKRSDVMEKSKRSRLSSSSREKKKIENVDQQGGSVFEPELIFVYNNLSSIHFSQYRIKCLRGDLNEYFFGKKKKKSELSSKKTKNKSYGIFDIQRKSEMKKYLRYLMETLDEELKVAYDDIEKKCLASLNEKERRKFRKTCLRVLLQHVKNGKMLTMPPVDTKIVTKVKKKKNGHNGNGSVRSKNGNGVRNGAIGVGYSSGVIHPNVWGGFTDPNMKIEMMPKPPKLRYVRSKQMVEEEEEEEEIAEEKKVVELDQKKKKKEEKEKEKEDKKKKKKNMNFFMIPAASDSDHSMKVHLLTLKKLIIQMPLKAHSKSVKKKTVRGIEKKPEEKEEDTTPKPKESSFIKILELKNGVSEKEEGEKKKAGGKHPVVRHIINLVIKGIEREREQEHKKSLESVEVERYRRPGMRSSRPAPIRQGYHGKRDRRGRDRDHHRNNRRTPRKQVQQQAKKPRAIRKRRKIMGKHENLYSERKWFERACVIWERLIKEVDQKKIEKKNMRDRDRDRDRDRVRGGRRFQRRPRRHPRGRGRGRNDQY